MRFENKTVVITGGASDMGIACAEKFLEEGAVVTLIDINEAVLSKSAPLKEQYPGMIHTYKGTVCSNEDMENGMRFAIETMGKISILVNCAGYANQDIIEKLTPYDWKISIDVTLSGIFRSCKAAVPYMKEANYGRIINVASIGGRANRPVSTTYSTPKAAICGMGRALANELKPWNITVNTMAPGPINAGMFKKAGDDPSFAKAKQMLESTVVLGRLGEMSEIACGILYFADDAAASVTGEIMDINGGAYMC